MAQAAKSQEPSMEEILASIRRIIAEDDSEKPGPHPAEAPGVDLNPDAAASSLGAARAMGESYPAPAPETPTSSIDTFPGTAKPARSPSFLDIGEPMTSSAPRVAVPTPESKPVPTARIDHAAPDADAAGSGGRGAADDDRANLMSTATSAAVDSAFNALAQTVLVHNARTLEDLVREMLRPMLKVWLDDNLPGMVERLVRAEIERVSRGR
jgi:cell pole-organizing protein PopZ